MNQFNISLNHLKSTIPPSTTKKISFITHSTANKKPSIQDPKQNFPAKIPQLSHSKTSSWIAVKKSRVSFTKQKLPKKAERTQCSSSICPSQQKSPAFSKVQQSQNSSIQNFTKNTQRLKLLQVSKKHEKQGNSYNLTTYTQFRTQTINSKLFASSLVKNFFQDKILKEKEEKISLNKSRSQVFLRKKDKELPTFKQEPIRRQKKSLTWNWKGAYGLIKNNQTIKRNEVFD